MVSKIVIVGPPCSGKSVFTLALLSALEDLGISCSFVDLDLWGSTFLLLSGKESSTERTKRKETLVVTKDDIENKLKEFQDISDVLVIADGPGKISTDLNTLIQPAKLGIIVCRIDKPNDLKKWRNYLEKHGIEIIGIVHTTQNTTESVSMEGHIEATITNLDRDNSDISSGVHSFASKLKSLLGV